MKKSALNSHNLSPLWMPLVLIVVYLLVTFLLRDILPTTEEISNNFSQLFAKYGYEIVFFGAFLEAALIIDLLVPGASVVLVGAYFSSIGLLSYPQFLLVSVSGFFLGYFMDFLIGYYGWSDILNKFGFGKHLGMAREKIKKWEGKSFLVGYFHPDLASFFAVAAGTLHMNVRKFALYNFLASLIWISIWTGLVYLFGPVIQGFFEGNIILGLMAVLTIVPLLSWIVLKKVRVVKKLMIGGR